MNVGFVGLGRLGRHLAANVLGAGFPLTVHDLDAARALDGAAWADSPRALAEAVDVVITCLPSPAALEEVLDDVLPALDGTWIDVSTTGRDNVLRLAERAAAAGVATIEAPVTGGVHRAAAGETTVIVGGDEAAVAAHRPLLDALGRPVFHVGPLGSASVLKVITNMLAFIHLVAAGDALMLAKRAGLDLAQTYEVIRASSGSSFVHETESQVILNGSYDIGFTIELALKDLGLARELGADLGVPLELASLVERAFRRARERYGASAWSPTVVKLLEDELGTELRAPGFPPSL